MKELKIPVPSELKNKLTSPLAASIVLPHYSVRVWLPAIVLFTPSITEKAIPIPPAALAIPEKAALIAFDWSSDCLLKSFIYRVDFVRLLSKSLLFSVSLVTKSFAVLKIFNYTFC